MARAQQPVILPDPELLLPDEQLPPHDEIEAVSDLFGGKYPSIASLIRARRKVEFALGEHITEHQRAHCVPGSWAWFEITRRRKHRLTDEVTEVRVTVFGEIPDVEDLEKTERASNPKNDAYARMLRRRVVDAHNRGWLFGKWYSVLAPNGEWGAMHISTLEPMTRESFLARQSEKWITT